MTYAQTFGASARRRVWVRGDSYPLRLTVFLPPDPGCLDGPFPRCDLTGASIVCTMKLWRRLGEPLNQEPVVIKKTSDNTEEVLILDQNGVLTKGQAVILFQPDDSKFLDPGIYRYDVQVRTADGYTRTLINDEVYLRDDISSAEDLTQIPDGGGGGGSGGGGGGGTGGVVPAHASSHGLNGGDALSPASIGAASIQQLNAAIENLTAMIEDIDILGPINVAINAHVAAADPHGDRAWFETRSFAFTQASPNTTWVINHNLGFTPVVALFTVGGVEIEGEVVHSSVNQVQVSFAVALTGTARLT